MRISFLLGPAGTGKTFRCLAEIRNELRAHPDGLPLIFIAPKQSTYQLERQLLEGDDLTGYSRLHILSFERLARFVFNELKQQIPRFLTEQGRTMVLGAVLNERRERLKIFRNAARRLGFAEEVSKQIREFQNHGLSAAAVRRLSAEISQPSAREKLRDLAEIYEGYCAWLAEQELEDGDALLTAATELVEKAEGLRIGGIWFDGFAQLTPQEMRFLEALLRLSERATLAFCVDHEAPGRTETSGAFLVQQTVGRCRSAIETRFGANVVKVEILERKETESRFRASTGLRELERHWNSTRVCGAAPGDAVRLVQAADPEGEAIFVAREIVRHVRAGGRYREVALLLRDLQSDYAYVLRRVFRRYGIPFFLDRRESISHHPLAELTRGSLRTAAFHFQHRDWFATLKCGLIRGAKGEELDELENEALARGWSGAAWRTGFRIPTDADHERRLNQLRERLLEPFSGFASAMGAHNRLRAEEIVEAVKDLWDARKVQDQLERWSREDPESALHSTVWDQMNAWLEDFALAFRRQQMPLVEWLPIVEVGLSGLTVGVVPPVLDQVLIGAVDRSRNPDLKVLFVLGVNERIFPAPAGQEMLLTDEDRTALATTGCAMSETPGMRLAGEQFYGYIACTRPRERLVLSYSRTALDGTQLNPSRFISQVQRIFPKIEIESFVPPAKTEEIVHGCELRTLGINGTAGLENDSTEAWRLTATNQVERLEPELAHRLYGDELQVSVSALERFAACPYQFFALQGLRVREREEFLLDVREQGSFQHEVLKEFHEELTREGLKWRDVSPAEAKERTARIADDLLKRFRDGLLVATEQNRFTAENYKRTLQEFVSVVVDWFAMTNRFDPAAVEFGFGQQSELPGWRLPLRQEGEEKGKAFVLHGRVDRIDLHRIGNEAYCVIIDYKSGSQAPDKTLLHHGVQQQLPAYLLALTRVKEIAAVFRVDKMTAAGCFLLPLKAQGEKSRNRREALDDPMAAKRAAYTHEGLYDLARLELLDSSAPEQNSAQFRFRLKRDGEPYGNTFNALKSEDFQQVLARSEELIKEIGMRIYAGDIAIHPYKKGELVACKRCKVQPICRFDPWTQPYNILRLPEPAECVGAGKSKAKKGAKSA